LNEMAFLLVFIVWITVLKVNCSFISAHKTHEALQILRV